MLDKKYASSCKSSIGSLPSFNPVSNVVYFRKKTKAMWIQDDKGKFNNTQTQKDI